MTQKTTPDLPRRVEGDASEPSPRRRYRAVARPRDRWIASGLFLLLLSCVCAGGWSGLELGRARERFTRRADLHDHLNQVLARATEAQGAWDAVRRGTKKTGLLIRLRDRRDLVGLQTKLRGLAKTEPGGDALVTRIFPNLDSLLAVTHESILLRLDARAANEEGKAAEAVSLTGRAEQMEDQAQASFELLLHAVVSAQHDLAPDSEAFRVASSRFLGLLVLTTLVAAALMLHLRRMHAGVARALERALLTEDLLESYGGRLELAQQQLEHGHRLKAHLVALTAEWMRRRLADLSERLTRVSDAGLPATERSTEIEAALALVERVSTQSDHLLGLCRLEDGRAPIRITGMDSESVVESVLRRHRAEAARKGLALFVTAPNEGWPRVAADADRFAQVLDHLVQNAIRFTSRGSIRVTGRKVEFPAEALRIDVIDTGSGIDRARIPALLDLAGSGRNDDAGPGGLGLILGQYLARAMNGQIGLDSEGQDRGARAWLILPLAQRSDDLRVETLPAAPTVSSFDACPLPPSPEPRSRAA